MAGAVLGTVKRRGFLGRLLGLLIAPSVVKALPEQTAAPVFNARLLAALPINEAQEIAWQRAIILGCRGRVNPFAALVGRPGGERPICEVMNFQKP